MRVLLGVIWTLLGSVYFAGASCPQSPSTGPFTFTATVPEGCQQATCDYYLAVKVNSETSSADFYIEGSASGYVALGLSSSGSMDNSDVLACARDPFTGNVDVVDAYNGPSYTNRRDAMQNLHLQSANFSNGRIYCCFSRPIDTGDSINDKVLNGSYFLLYAAVDDSPVAVSGGKLSLQYHSSQTPTVSASALSIVAQVPTALTTTPAISIAPATSGCPPPPMSSEVYSFVATIPTNCSQSSCDYYFAAKINKNNPLYLDFLLEGRAKGYAAIGFSSDGKMASSDVLACAIDSLSPNGASIVDTYNTVGYGNIRDTVQDICSHSILVDNGHIRCSFSRLIDTGDLIHDKSLNKSYYLLYAAVDAKPVGSGSTLSLSKHSQTPPKTSEPVNIIKATGSALVISSFPKEALTKVHAIFMLIAWPLLATTGIFFAAWMKPALPPPPLPATWFKIHRVLMLASLLIGAAGFIIIFIANIPTQGLIAFTGRPSALAHFVIGILITALHIINPIISAFRCAPDHPSRWIFNFIHGSLIGTGVLLLALTNCGIGTSLFDATEQKYIFWVYLGYVVYLLLLLITTFLVFTGVALSVGGEEGPKLGPAMVKPILTCCLGNRERKGTAIQLQNLQQSNGGIQRSAILSLNHKPKHPLKPLSMPTNIIMRWIFLSFILVGVVSSTIVLVILIAIQH